jgi:hypothetical protein
VHTLELELSEFTRRVGSLLVAHTATALPRGLEPGESVLVRDGARAFYIATVRDISFELTDTHYRLELGAPMDATQVLAARRDALVADARDSHSRVDIPELLALLRAARPLAPEPRPARADVAKRIGR